MRGRRQPGETADLLQLLSLLGLPGLAPSLGLGRPLRLPHPLSVSYRAHSALSACRTHPALSAHSGYTQELRQELELEHEAELGEQDFEQPVEEVETGAQEDEQQREGGGEQEVEASQRVPPPSPPIPQSVPTTHPPSYTHLFRLLQAPPPSLPSYLRPLPLATGRR